MASLADLCWQCVVIQECEVRNTVGFKRACDRGVTLVSKNVESSGIESEDATSIRRRRCGGVINWFHPTSFCRRSRSDAIRAACYRLLSVDSLNSIAVFL